MQPLLTGYLKLPTTIVLINNLQVADPIFIFVYKTKMT